MIERYGYLWPDVSDEQIELACIANWYGTGPEMGAHFTRALDLLFSQERIGKHGIVVTPWTVERAQILARHMRNGDRHGRYAAVWGPGAAGKTVDFAALALTYWLADPTDTIVVCASTSIAMLERRIWGVIRSLYEALEEPCGKLDRTDHCVRAPMGTKCGGIYGIAVWQGDVDKSLANIFGTHARRVLVVVDEAQGTERNIFEARTNLRLGAMEFILVMLGNPTGIATPLGEFSEPLGGWTDLDMTKKDWPAKRGGWVYWFDGLESPAVKEPEKYPWLINAQQIAEVAREFGEASVEYIVQARGFIPLSALACDNLFNDEFVVRTRMSDAVFDTDFVTLASYGGFDPSVTGHGDKAAYQFADVVRLADGSYGVRFHNDGVVEVKLGGDPPTYQMASAFIERAMELGVPLKNLACDSTSVQQAIADMCDLVIAKKLGLDNPERIIYRVSYVEKASHSSYSDAPGVPADERFASLVTEMWYVLYELAKRRKARGLSMGTIAELMSRRVDTAQRKWMLETKRDLRKRGIHSPNKADAVLIVLACIFRDYGTALLNAKSYLRQEAERLFAPATPLTCAHGCDYDPIMDVKV